MKKLQYLLIIVGVILSFNLYANKDSRQLDFFNAALTCNVEAVEMYIKEGQVDINAYQKSGWVDYTPLTAAAYKGCEEVGEILLNAGADINARGPGGFTALMAAAYKGHPKFIAMLLKRPKIDLFLVNRGGLTALDLAKLTEENIKQVMRDSDYISEWTMRSYDRSFNTMYKVINMLTEAERNKL